MMTAIRRHWHNVQTYIWWVGGLLCLLLAFIAWILTDQDELVEVAKPIESGAQIQIQPEKVATMTYLGALPQEVRPLDLTSRVVTVGQHEPEFRGTKFMKEQQKQWTVELFRVSEEDIIKNFLQQRADRRNFVYFRLSGQDQAEQYVLCYGVFQNMDAAREQLGGLDLKLPASIQPQVHSFADYVPFVNDLGGDEISAGSKLYEVRLNAVALPQVPEIPNPVKKAVPNASKQSNVPATTTPSTTTTITRRDQEGNVVEVQRSQSHTAGSEAPSAPVAE